MQIHETYRKFPIKFYKKEDGSIYYENKFLSGTAKNMDLAFKAFSEHDWEKELVYYYDDVLNVEFGAFTPAYTDKKYKGMLYLGQIDLRLDIDSGFGTGEHSVTYLSKNKDAQKDHAKYISNMKRQEKISNFKNRIKNGLKKLAGSFSEMFDPFKTRYDLICDYCGEIIPTGTYYEEYEKKNYHLECIWDKYFNTNSESYEDCKEFFMSLQKHIGNWPPYQLDCEEDYLSDLELVKINNRRVLKEEAAMIASKHNSFEEFYNYCLKNPKLEQKLYFECFSGTIRVPSDTINHAWKKHKTTCEQWLDMFSNIHNIQNAQKSKKQIQQRDVYLTRIMGFKDYGVAFMDCPKYMYIQTLFIDNANKIDSWIYVESGGQLTGKPLASLGDNSNIRRVRPTDSNSIIAYIKEKIKG